VVTVGELLTLPEVHDATVLVGAAGLSRPVTGINVMEVPDVESFVRPGEILLTTLYPLRARTATLAALIQSLDATGLAGLAVKPGRYVGQLPADAVAAAEDLGFPILLLGPDTSFNDVIGAVVTVLLAEKGGASGRGAPSWKTDRRLKTLFLEELLAGAGAVAESRAFSERSRLFGLDPAGWYVVLVAAADRQLEDAGVGLGAERPEVLPPGSFAWARGVEAFAVAPCLDSARALLGSWRAALGNVASAQVTVGGGGAVRPSNLAASQAAARLALRVAVATRRPVLSHDEVGLEGLLLGLEPAALAAFVESELGLLIAADAVGSADLCRTLKVYLGGGNAAETARSLYIHYNTMKYRLARISEILGVDLHEPNTRLRLALALAARPLLGATTVH